MIDQMPESYYGGKLTFEEGDHVYRFNGEKVPSVTTILQQVAKPALVPWAAKLVVEHIKGHSRPLPSGAYHVTPEDLAAAKAAPRAVRDQAGSDGTAVHNYAEAVLNGERTPTLKNEAQLAGAAAFEDWFESVTVEAIALERIVFSRRLWYAGKFDFFGKINGRYCILDFKTSSGVWPEYWLQIAAYEHALREETRINDPLDHVIIHLDKKSGEFAVHYSNDDNGKRAATFACLCTVHETMTALKNVKTKLVKDVVAA